MVHALKIYPEHYEAVKSGKKPFEVRRNDRDYKVGDILALNEFSPIEGDECEFTGSSGKYTGCSIFARISYVLEDTYYCKPGYVVLGLTPCEISYFETTKELMKQFGLPIYKFKEVKNND